MNKPDDHGHRTNGSAPGPETMSADEQAPEPQKAAERREQRTLVVDGVEWIAYINGRGAYGTGRWGLASVQAVHFATAETPDVPVWEALLPVGRFSGLYHQELVELFRTARRIVVQEGRAPPVTRRFNLGEDLS